MDDRKTRSAVTAVLAIALLAAAATAENWNQQRGPRQDGCTKIADLPLTWSNSENLRWKADLPGPGASSPAVWGDRVFVTAHSGYELDKKANAAPEDLSHLRLHVLCFDARTGKKLWDRSFEPKHLMFPAATSPMNLHGFTTATPAADANAVYVSFSNGGFWALSHDGAVLWEGSIGSECHRWGSGASPVLYKDMVIVNADIESHCLMALNRHSGQVVWRQTEGMPQGEKKTWHNGYSWSTPVVVHGKERDELILLTPGLINAYNPADGSVLWQARTIGGYAMSTPIARDGVIYSIMGSSHHPVTSVAYRTGDIPSKQREIWRVENTGSAVSGPVLVEGRLYWAGFHGGMRPATPAGFCCMDPNSGELIYKTTPDGCQLRCVNSAGVYASALAAPGQIYYVTQTDGTYVVAPQERWRILAHNRIAGDDSCFNGSPVPLAHGGLLLRSDKALYCVGSTGPQATPDPARPK